MGILEFLFCPVHGLLKPDNFAVLAAMWSSFYSTAVIYFQRAVLFLEEVGFL
jgi:hypothetical protein